MAHPFGLGIGGGLAFVYGSGLSLAEQIAELFASGEDGAWYDPSDLTTLFQERTGASATTPAEVGDVVGTILDKSGNANHAVAPSDAARPVLRQDGSGYYYLDFDGTDDNVAVSDTSAMNFGTTGFNVFHAVSMQGSSAFDVVWGKGNNSSADNFRGFFDNVDKPALFAGSDAQAPNPFPSLTITRGTASVVMWGRSADNATDLYRVDGTAENETRLGIAGTGSNSLSMTIGDGPSGAYKSEMQWYGGVFIDRVLTADEIANVESYLASKSGATLA